MTILFHSRPHIAVSVTALFHSHLEIALQKKLSTIPNVPTAIRLIGTSVGGSGAKLKPEFREIPKNKN